ncbi:MAG: hypothetical protein M1820_010857 [Bogoriella megaspora]|nr:MAG: hypothetical protein M1820_010857 [Bogoriella megaspora]
MSFDDFQNDPYWKNRRLTPAQLLVHDIGLETSRNGSDVLGIKEILSSNLVPDEFSRDQLRDVLSVTDISGSHPIENQKWSNLVSEFGWLQSLRAQKQESAAFASSDTRKCRWIHISSKLPDYLAGCLLGLSDWQYSPKGVADSMRQLDYCLQRYERFSKHGRYFTPFFQSLSPAVPSSTIESPLLISIPFLDWSVQGKTPELRFQIDKAERYASYRTPSHILRSILQHFYRLEDTDDREKDCVFNKSRPWTTDRELDLKVRRWYGYYPTKLIVDELWILVIDSQNIVTFSANQSWKSRSPPAQLSARISDVAFRSLRNSFFVTARSEEYNAMTHVTTCLNGAMGMLHRSFWTDVILCLTDSHRAPSTKLLMDLLQIQEELNIVIRITQDQLNLITALKKASSKPNGNNNLRSTVTSMASSSDNDSEHADGGLGSSTPFDPATLRQHSFHTQLNPLAQLLENLQRELVDLHDLHENSNSLVTRTVQLVNIRLEDHGKAILVFTIVTIIFLPLSFVSSFFGMNFADIRNMSRNQGLFWLVACCVTSIVVCFSMLLAFYGAEMSEKFFLWKQQQRELFDAWTRKRRARATRARAARNLSFEVLQAQKEPGGGGSWVP